MRRALTDDYAVPCPLCKAVRGELCINVGHGSRFQGEVHRERRRAAQEAVGGRIVVHNHDSGHICYSQPCPYHDEEASRGV